LTSSSRLKPGARRAILFAASGIAAFGGLSSARAAEALLDQPVSTAAPGDSAPPNRLNPTGRDVSLSAPLHNNGFVLGEIDFTLGGDDSIRLGSQRLLELMRPVLSPDKVLALQAAVNGRAQIDAKDLGSLGYAVTYDPRSISLTIDIPAGSRPARSLEITDLDRERVGQFTKPASLAGYVNARGSVDYVWTGPAKGVGDPVILFDGAMRFHGVVFESEGSFEGGSSNKFLREGSRFVWDDIKHDSRWTLGDLKPVTRGFSGASPMAGVSVLRSYSILEPQRNVQPRGEQTFTLVRPSTVEAFINGQSVRQIRLDAGTYNVSDFPFAQGANNVQLVITDDAGGKETLSFSLFFDRTLLAPGLAEYSLNVGVLAPFANGSRTYTSDWTASGYYRRGINQSLTAGFNFQAQKSGQVIGGEFVYASPIGTFGADGAYSHNDGIGSGYAFNASFQRLFRAEGARSRAIALTFETRSVDFTTPGTLTPDNRFSYQVGATFSQGISEYQFISVDARHAQGRAGFRNDDTVRVDYGYRFNARANLQIEASYENGDTGRGVGARISLTYRFGERSSAQVDYDSQGQEGRVSYQTSRGQGVGAWSASADVTQSGDATGVDANFNMTSNRAEWGLSHTSSFAISGGGLSDQRSSLRGGTAIVFADGHFALSRPVYDSFAIVATHPSLAGHRVEIQPQEGHYTSRSGLFGPAVASDLTSYSDRAVTFDVPDAPAGYDLGAGAFRVYAPYRSGYLITVGSDYSVTAIGRLVDSDGSPIPLLAGQAFEVSQPTHPPVTLFTNRDGRFGAQGLRPGKWRIEMPTSPETVFIITVPEKADGIVRLGDVRPEASK
jgi:outer membrane usher protein